MSIQNHAMRAAGGLVFSLAGSVAFAVPHAPIVINSDTQFTAVNGVSNPSASGTAADPYIIPDLSINGAGNYCIQVNNTTRHFELRNIGCTNAAIGITFSNLKHGKLLNSNISAIRGNGGFGTIDGIGVHVIASNQVTLSGNTLSNISGQPASTAGSSAGSAFGILLRAGSDFTVNQNRIYGLYGAAAAAGNSSVQNGGAGGSAIGLYNPFGMILQTPNLKISGNRFEQFFAAPGGNGAAGGEGGSGGMAAGVYSDNAPGLSATGNTVLNLYGGVGGTGGGGSGAGGNGLGGGYGGMAVGFWITDTTNVTNQNNSVQNLTGANGGKGGAGAFNSSGAGGKGGNGSSGGEASGLRFDNVQGISNQGNILNTLNGGRGGDGGSGGVGNTGTAMGGNGGNGGPGAGLHYRVSSAYTHVGNTIANNHGGAGGSGAAGGMNGTPGSSLPIFVN